MVSTDAAAIIAVVLSAVLVCLTNLLLGMGFGRFLQALWRWHAEPRYPERLSRIKRWGMEREAMGDRVRTDWVGRLVWLLIGLLTGSAVGIAAGLFTFTFLYMLAALAGPLAVLAGLVIPIGVFTTPALLMYSRYTRLCQESSALSGLFPHPIGDVRVQRVVAVYRWVSRRRELREEFEFAVRTRRLTALEAVSEFESGPSLQRKWTWLIWVSQRVAASVLTVLILCIIGLVVIHTTDASALDVLIPGGRPPVAPAPR